MQENVSEGQIILAPNRSSSWPNILRFIFVSATLTLLIGVVFAFLGAWLILPFAGLEIVLIAALCRWMYHHHTDKEVVLLQGDKLAVIQRHAGHERRHEFQRYWTRVRLEPSEHVWYPSRLLIGSHGHYVELGANITESARKKLAQDLQGLLDQKE